MNMMQRYKGIGSTILESIDEIKFEMHMDFMGFWVVITRGNHGFNLNNLDLRKFIYLAVRGMMEDGGIVIEPSRDPTRYWEHATRLGSTPDEIARNVVAEWVSQGEPEIDPYEGIAFVEPRYLTHEINIRPPERR